MTKVCLYARVSTKEQKTDNQIIRLRKFAEDRGFEVYDEYIDIRSGKDANRPELKRMLADAKTRKFDKILSVKLDRLGRSVKDLLSILETVDNYGVRVEFLDQNIDTSTAMGRMIFTVLSGVAQFERDLIVQRTMDGLARARKEGKTFGHPKTKLSDYQIEKAKKLLKENPEISMRELAKNFTGISRPTLIRNLKDLGILGEDGKVTGGVGVYKETSEISGGNITSDCSTSEDGV